MASRAPATLLLLLAALLFAQAPSHAKDRKKDKEAGQQKSEQEEKPAVPAPTVHTFTEEEIETAWSVLEEVPSEVVIVINNLRFLMRPKYEAELMAGRAVQPCPLAPFEDNGGPQMHGAEQLRLWAVLASGMPLTDSTRYHLLRFLDSQTTEPGDSLGPFAVQLGVCYAALKRGDSDLEDRLRERAGEVLDAAMKLHRGTDDDSPLIVGEVILPMWFANQAWRAVICRMALAMELKFNEHVWETALRNLCGTGYKSRGWNGRGRGAETPLEDLDTNLFAITALDLALHAPEKTLGTGPLRTIEKDAKFIPEVLSRLERDYLAEPLVGTRMAMIRTFSPDTSPASREPQAWHDAVLEAAVRDHSITGVATTPDSVAAELGVTGRRRSRTSTRITETAMNCLGHCGGLLGQGEAPLSGMTLTEIGQIMHALSVLHASASGEGEPQYITNVPGVEDAIQRGCEFLVKMQKRDGSFSGGYSNLYANTAIAVLALLHGGWSRDSEPVKLGISQILRRKDDDGKPLPNSVWTNFFASTYSDGITLMMFQKYYEKEQRDSGILWADTPEEFKAAAKKTWDSLDGEHRAAIEAMIARTESAQLEGSRGGWGYSAPARGGKMPSDSHWDNSNAQFAMLGYKAASMLGAPVKSRKEEQEARRLIDDYGSREGAEIREYSLLEDVPGQTSSEVWQSRIKVGGWGYNGQIVPPNTGMTGAGLSTLAICRDELKVRGELSRDLSRKIALAIHGAQASLADDYFHLSYRRDQLLRDRNYAFEQWGRGDGSADGMGLYYDLYAVERGAVLAGIPLFDWEVDWYEIGAEGLIRIQRSSGDWHGPKDDKNPDAYGFPQIINTSMAILFLKKAAPPVVSEPGLREPKIKPPTPVTNGPKAKPINPATPGPNGKPKPLRKAPTEGKKDKPEGPVTKGPKGEDE